MTAIDRTAQELRVRYPELVAEDLSISVGAGWLGIVDKLLASIAEIVRPAGEPCRFLAAENSHGALRLEFECDARWEYSILRQILLAEFRSRSTCEVCGVPGHMRRSGWRVTRCDDHASDNQKTDPPHPAWTIGRETPHGYVWYDPVLDDVVIVEDLASIGMPASSIAMIEADRARSLPRRFLS